MLVALPELLSGDSFGRLLVVIGVDLILAGDNAVVIAMAARRLEGPRRRRAIVLGATGAVALRLAFATVVIYLLAIPFLQAVGAALLGWISWKLVYDEPAGEGERSRRA